MNRAKPREVSRAGSTLCVLRNACSSYIIDPFRKHSLAFSPMLLSLLKKLVRSSKDIVKGFHPGHKYLRRPQFELTVLEARVLRSAD